MQYIIVGLGGIFGSISRYKLGKLIAERSNTDFPVSTFIINVSGALLLGIVSNLGFSNNLYVLLGDGFLGAYTTFSTFMYEGFNLFRENAKMNAAAYIGLSMTLGLIFYSIGAYLIRILIS